MPPTRPRSGAISGFAAIHSPAERIALMEIERQRQRNLAQLFKGTEFVPKMSAQAKRAQELAEAAKNAATETRRALGQIGVPVVDIHLPDISLPNISIPSIALPELGLPNLPAFDIPDFGLPGFDLPSVRFPDLGIPDFNIPRFDLPGVALPNLNLPDFDLNLPNIHIPQLRVPSIDIPGLGSLDLRIPGIRHVLQLLIELFDGLDLPDIALEIGAEFIVDWVATALPVLGQIKSGAQAAMEWGRAARRGYQVYQVGRQKAFILPGDPVAAADAVRVLLQREAAMHSGKASIRTTQFATSTAALALDAGAISGPLISTGSALANLSLRIYAIATQHKERVAGNELLRQPEQLDAQVFGASPLLGAYLLTCSNTSDVINLLTSSIGAPGWMNDAERMKRKIDPLLTESTKLIRASPYELKGLKSNKGIYLPKKKWYQVF